MQMGNALAGVGAVVDDEPVAAGELEFFRDDARHDEEMAELGFVVGGGFTDAWNKFFRDDQQMNGRLRLDVVDDDAAVVLVLDLGGDFAVDDFLEERFRHGG